MKEGMKVHRLDIVEGVRGAAARALDGERREGGMPGGWSGASETAAGGAGGGVGAEGVDEGGKPYLRIFFRCAGAYLRVYRNALGTQYMARCPKCAKTMTFRVGSGGTGKRFFEVSC